LFKESVFVKYFQSHTNNFVNNDDDGGGKNDDHGSNNVRKKKELAGKDVVNDKKDGVNAGKDGVNAEKDGVNAVQDGEADEDLFVWPRAVQLISVVCPQTPQRVVTRSSPTKSIVKPPTYMSFPYMNKRTKVTSLIQRLEFVLGNSLFAMQGDNETVFQTRSGQDLSSVCLNMETLAPRLWIDSNVIYYWVEILNHEELVKDTNGLIRFKKKLQDLKKIIRNWIKDKKLQQSGGRKFEILSWYYNKKRSQLLIRGVFVDGDWNTDPEVVKDVFKDHFETRFKQPAHGQLKLNISFPNRVSTDQVADMDRSVSRDEIRGNNSSFIALIPKVTDAKFVTDFRPISLIGCVYKVVTKILANRLATVNLDLVFDIQSAFVANRQNLDGPFILNELLAWCKRKKKQAMIFKVDFAKAYDSVHWDYLLDVLQAFGFSPNWCKWIRGTFSSAMASILATSLIGCAVMQNPFRYLGVMVGDSMSRKLAWADTVKKLRSWLSKWKVKTLSIGGRLTLLKLVLDASPLCNMSIYKVPKGVLKEMEAIRCNFFTGTDPAERKIT
nr:RNA-directed DNA polymerase, eukaryota [Tanacetum cinerariifolium]